MCLEKDPRRRVLRAESAPQLDVRQEVQKKMRLIQCADASEDHRKIQIATEPHMWATGAGLRFRYWSEMNVSHCWNAPLHITVFKNENELHSTENKIDFTWMYSRRLSSDRVPMDHLFQGGANLNCFLCFISKIHK